MVIEGRRGRNQARDSHGRRACPSALARVRDWLGRGLCLSSGACISCRALMVCTARRSPIEPAATLLALEGRRDGLIRGHARFESFTGGRQSASVADGRLQGQQRRRPSSKGVAFAGLNLWTLGKRAEPENPRTAALDRGGRGSSPRRRRATQWSGQVVRPFKGYGFISPSSGGRDVACTRRRSTRQASGRWRRARAWSM